MSDETLLLTDVLLTLCTIPCFQLSIRYPMHEELLAS